MPVSPLHLLIPEIPGIAAQKLFGTHAGLRPLELYARGVSQLEPCSAPIGLLRMVATRQRVKPETPVVEVADFRIDIPGRTVQVKNCDVRLTPKEFDLLVYLARHPGKVITHRALLGAVWGKTA